MLAGLCQWLEHWSVISWINNSVALSVLVEMGHYFGFFLLVGSIVIVDLRVLGIAGRRENIVQVAEPLFPLMWTGLGLVLLSGFVMFAGQATMFFPNRVFRLKMLIVLLAIGFAWFVQRSVRHGQLSQPVTNGTRLFALISLVLWIGAILAAVEIPHLTYVP